MSPHHHLSSNHPLTVINKPAMNINGKACNSFPSDWKFYKASMSISEGQVGVHLIDFCSGRRRTIGSWNRSRAILSSKLPFPCSYKNFTTYQRRCRITCRCYSYIPNSNSPGLVYVLDCCRPAAVQLQRCCRPAAALLKRSCRITYR